MKATVVYVIVISVFGVLHCYGQTEEQKEDQAATMEKLLDSMMNDAGMEGFMDQLKEMGEKQKIEMENGKAVEMKKQEKEKALTAKKGDDDFYWRNATASDTNEKMIDWKFGNSDIILNDAGKKIVVGNISNTGSVTFNLPKNITTAATIERGLIPEMHPISYEKIDYSDKNTPFRYHFSLPVMKNGEHIGNLYMGNAIEVAYNMAAPCCLERGHQGYRLYWTYVEKACTAKYKEENTTTLNSGNTVTYVEEYDLEFTPGWNFIKTEIIGNYGTERFKYKKHTVVSNILEDTRFFFWKN